jgi:hypothetical protein
MASFEDAPELPAAYSQLTGVNLEDRHHCIDKVFLLLRF